MKKTIKELKEEWKDSPTKMSFSDWRLAQEEQQRIVYSKHHALMVALDGLAGYIWKNVSIDNPELLELMHNAIQANKNAIGGK